MGLFQGSRTQIGGDYSLHLRRGQSSNLGVPPLTVAANVSTAPRQIPEITAALWPLWVELFPP